MDKDLRTEFGLSHEHVRGAVVSTGLGLLSLAVATLLGLSDTRLPVVVLLGLVGALATGLGLTLTWSWLSRKQLTIGSTGICVRTRWRTTSIPWVDVESWWIGVPAEMAAQRVGREMLLATPAPHVGDPGFGSRRGLWSKRRRCWVICEPVRTDGSSEELAAALCRFAPNKRRR